MQERRNPIANALQIRFSCKKDVTPLPTHWSYVFLALIHRFNTTLLAVIVEKIYQQHLVDVFKFHNLESTWRRFEDGSFSSLKHYARLPRAMRASRMDR